MSKYKIIINQKFKKMAIDFKTIVQILKHVWALIRIIKELRKLKKALKKDNDQELKEQVASLENLIVLQKKALLAKAKSEML